MPVQDLGLGKTVNTIIGDERARGVSGGERKRVSIGVGKQVMPCCSSVSRAVGLRALTVKQHNGSRCA